MTIDALKQLEYLVSMVSQDRLINSSPPGISDKSLIFAAVEMGLG